MIGKNINQNQRDIFKPLLSDFIDLSHELSLLAQRIDWSYFDKEFLITIQNEESQLWLSDLWLVA